MKKIPILLGLLDMLSFEHPERHYPSLTGLTSNNPTVYLSSVGGFDGSPAAHLSDMGMNFFFAARSIDLTPLRELFPASAVKCPEPIAAKIFPGFIIHSYPASTAGNMT